MCVKTTELHGFQGDDKLRPTILLCFRGDGVSPGEVSEGKPGEEVTCR